LEICLDVYGCYIEDVGALTQYMYLHSTLMYI